MVDHLFHGFLIVAGAVFGSLSTHLYSRGLHRRETAKLLASSFALTNELDSQLSTMSNQCAELGDQLARAKEEAIKYKGLADLHISKNAQFEAQARDAWQRLTEYGLRAGNAQAWLFRELENAVRIVNKYKQEKGEKPVEVNPQLVAMLSDIKRDIEAV